MNSQKQLQNLKELIDTMALLRSDNGCQWDRQQTPESLKMHILEEAYELLEAIDTGNPDNICDELGDLLLQVVFQAQIFAEKKQFDISDVAQTINDKLKRRHPHIFADASHKGHEQRWEEIKQQERTARGQLNTLAARIPNNLPALKRATKLAKKCPEREPLEMLLQMQQQLHEVEVLIRTESDDLKNLREQLGQLLINICHFSATTGLDPEDLLRTKTTQLISEIDSENDAC